MERMISENTNARLLDGAVVAAQIKQEVQDAVARMVEARGYRPCLAAVRVGDDPASAVYVRNKIKACEEVGIRSEHHALPESISTTELLDSIRDRKSTRLNSSHIPL